MTFFKKTDNSNLYKAVFTVCVSTIHLCIEFVLEICINKIQSFYDTYYPCFFVTKTSVDRIKTLVNLKKKRSEKREKRDKGLIFKLTSGHVKLVRVWTSLKHTTD